MVNVSRLNVATQGSEGCGSRLGTDPTSRVFLCLKKVKTMVAIVRTNSSPGIGMPLSFFLIVGLAHSDSDCKITFLSHPTLVLDRNELGQHQGWYGQRRYCNRNWICVLDVDDNLHPVLEEGE